MAQARKKTDTTFTINIFRFLTQGLREGVFLLCSGAALYLLIALLSYHPQDRAWSHDDGVGGTQNLVGVIGAWFSDITLYFLGYMAYSLPLAVFLLGWHLFRRGAVLELDAEIVLLRFMGFVVAVCAACSLLFLYLGGSEDAVAGGVLGSFIGENLITAFGALGGGLFLLILFLAGVNLATGLPWVNVLDMVGQASMAVITAIGTSLLFVYRWGWDRTQRAATDPETTRPPMRRRRRPQTEQVVEEPVLPPEPPAPEVPVKRREPVIRNSEPESISVADEPEDAPPFAVKPPSAATPMAVLPPLDLLDMVSSEHAGYSAENLEDMSRQVEIQLQHFNIEVQVVAVAPGPVITRFELEPAPGVKVSQITNLAKDLARGLSVTSVRVVEVIPGKSVIGLEIPNEHREIVYLGEILDSAAYVKSTSPLTLTLGKDIGGNPVVVDLARMPHLLVAGTTGSGKSVAVNSMILSMLYKATPQEARFILIDPKMLELSIYEGIPHLLAPVVTDMKEAANALRWCVAEMERRYRLMAALKVRNIAGFNRKVADAIEAGTPIDDPLFDPSEHFDEDAVKPSLMPLPFIVVVIDELADMMMIVGKKVEELIARLAQKARASGIHLILATQRPSVDVITGLIKANIPTRIAFQVSSKVDSRTILDQMGAEHLLGHGDMLYLPPGSGLPQRVHGAFVDDHEVHRVVEYLRRTGTPDYCEEILEEPVEAGGVFPLDGLGGGDGESDPLYDQAVRIVTESRRASISSVQRRLKIGYNRAARLIEDMESAGIVSAPEHNGSREVIAPPPPEV